MNKQTLESYIVMNLQDVKALSVLESSWRCQIQSEFVC
jgi:hypothetical protein